MDLNRLYGLLDAKHKLNEERAKSAKSAASKDPNVTMPGDINSEAPPETLIHEE